MQLGRNGATDRYSVPVAMLRDESPKLLTATTGASVATSGLTTNAGTGLTEVTTVEILAKDNPCYVKIAASPTAAVPSGSPLTTTSWYLPTDQPRIYDIPAGFELAAIGVGGTSYVFITRYA